jgi:hypothetical protein
MFVIRPTIFFPMYVKASYVINACVCVGVTVCSVVVSYQGADKSLARPTSWCILFDGENISFDASLVIYMNSTNIPPITCMIINRIYEHQNLLSL